MRGPRLIWTAVIALPVLAAATWALHEQFIWKNIRQIEPGVFRGAEQKAGALRRLIQHYEIRTVVCLVDPEPDEQATTESLGARWLWVPLGDPATQATFDSLERLADLVADPENRPVFFHCKRGIYRSNLAQAVYRMRCCGWSLDQSLAELRANGFDPDSSGGDNCCVELLEKYYRERVAAQGRRPEAAVRPTAN